jgi:hypothetical protein
MAATAAAAMWVVHPAVVVTLEGEEAKVATSAGRGTPEAMVAAVAEVEETLGVGRVAAAARLVEVEAPEAAKAAATQAAATTAAVGGLAAAASSHHLVRAGEAAAAPEAGAAATWAAAGLAAQPAEVVWWAAGLAASRAVRRVAAELEAGWRAARVDWEGTEAADGRGRIRCRACCADATRRW